MKEKLLADFMEKLTARFDAEDLGYISATLTKVLSAYEVTEKSTQLIPYDNYNDRVLKRYSACLYVDGKSKKTIVMYQRRLKAFSDFVGIPFDKVGTYDIRYYLATLKESGISDRSLENYRSYISAFYQWLTREDFIEKNPCEKIAPIKYREEIRKPFNDTEIDTIRSACRSARDRAMIELLLSSGVRVAELCFLDISDIDFINLSVRVRDGKGAKERITYITPVCAMHLKQYLLQRGDDDPALFLSAKRKLRLTPPSVRVILREVGKYAKVANVHPHRFRRTFATNLSKRGMDVQTIARLMGHSDIQTTMIYVALDESRVLNEYKKHTA